MKFTNVRFFMLMAIAFLNACSSVFPVKETVQNSKPTEAAPELLSPLQTKVQALLAQPNLYKNQGSQDSPDIQTQELFEAALTFKQQGDFSQARAVLLDLSQQYPNFSGIWLQLALLAKDHSTDEIQQKRNEMTQYLNKAISVNPLNYQAHNELALLLRQQGQFQQALSHYELALKSWPAFAEAYFNRGILYDLYLGKKSLALADYELYKALSNDDSRQLKGWIIDLQRQIKSAEPSEQTGAIL